MKRRGFLGFLGALGALPLLGKGEVEKEVEAIAAPPTPQVDVPKFEGYQNSRVICFASPTVHLSPTEGLTWRK